MVAKHVTCLVLVLAAATAGAGPPQYKCLFNHELLIVCSAKQNSPEHIQSFVEKLSDTDVDAVLCCPTMWRTNLFPSQVDPQWKQYRPEQPLSKFPSYDYIMRYLHAGGDPVRDTLEACRKCGKALFISYRMNDHHYVTDRDWPSHNAFWREHPQFWLGDSDDSPYSKSDRTRLFNYLHPEVRDHYFAILEELCTRYDVDGLELDFQRYPKFFPSDRIEEGTRVMTAFVERIKKLLERIGRARGTTLPLCVRVPETLAKCRAAGLDVPGWDARRLVEMINISSFYRHTLELGLQDFRAQTRSARLYAEMNYVTHQHSRQKFARRYTTPEIYRASALSFFARGADGLSFFNFDYVPASQRQAMTATLRRITDRAFLATTAQDYVIYPGFGTLPANNQKTLTFLIPNDPRKMRCQRAVLRVETAKPCSELSIGAWLNGRPLTTCEQRAPELFAALAHNEGYPAREALKFFDVPPDAIRTGQNEIQIQNLDRKRGSCQFFSVELALYPAR